MPTYEYACEDCNLITEAYQSFTDDPLTECPHCSGTLKRVFHPVGIMFKGSGFYSTDAKGGKGSKTSSNGQKGSSSSDTRSSSKTESKTSSETSSPAKSSESKSSDKS